MALQMAAVAAVSSPVNCQSVAVLQTTGTIAASRPIAS
ncbi:MAG: hypothetical protein BWY99_02819 [Synergistetes bacterium ADurb.BinA166]|nr:MAG: hypothetical protein BWY99_02819 [Synergistetes bacterium ADurb.BinA166]